MFKTGASHIFVIRRFFILQLYVYTLNSFSLWIIGWAMFRFEILLTKLNFPMIIQSMNDNADVSAGAAIEDIASKESKKKKFPFLKIFVIIVILVVFGGLGFYFLKNKNLSLNNKKTPETIESSSEVSVPEESPFSNFVEETSPPAGSGPPDILKHSMFFVAVSQNPDADLSRALSDGEILVEVVGNDNSPVCKVIASKNSSFNYQPGETMEFDFTADPEVIFVGKGNRVDYLLGLEDFKIPESLKIGDNIVFTCQGPTCESGVLSWMLILTN